MKRTIVITGGAGFIALLLVAQALLEVMWCACL